MNKNDLINELGFNFINYAAAVNTDRAIPDATSGLKPVARRILYGAYVGGRVSTKRHTKCAGIVGDVMGNYHPHGDTSIYEALVRLSRPWVMRYPLMDFHGNMGNISGDGPAAYRYTEARLSKLTEDGLLSGLKKRNVPFTSNYDESKEEPVTLPAIFPNLLCNPNAGIGVAMACNWLPHNLVEVADAIYDYMDGKEPMLPGPDFPTGGIVINKDDIPNILKTGHGSVKVRGKYKIEKNTNIVFYEIPFGVNTESIMNEIGKLSDEKEIEGITNIRDESDLKGIRLVIQCSKNVSVENIVKKLFLKTKLQTSISYNQVALVNKVPLELSLKDCIAIYIDHNESCLKRETEFDKQKAEARKEIVDGLLRALEDIDNIIAMIKKSKSSTDAKEQLIAKYNFTDNQAKAIVNMKLGSLAGLEKVELQNEAAALIKALSEFENILSNRDVRISIIRDRLQAIVKKYGDKRRTELVQIEVPKEEKEIQEVTPEDVVVILSQNGDIKRVPSKSFKVQRKNGKGVKNENAVLDIISTNTIDTLMLFSSSGKMYRLLVDNVPAGTNASKGVNINNLINIESNEVIMAITSLHRKTDAKYAVFITKNGLVKKTSLEEYLKVKRSTGIGAINIKEGDSLVNVTFLAEEDLVLVTKEGMTIHFKTSDISATGRLTSGVKGIKLNDNDEVVIGLPIHRDTDHLALFSSKGYGKKSSLTEIPLQNRAGKGTVIYKGNDNTGFVVGGAMVDDNDNILLMGKPNSICISAQDLPLLGRVSMGNIMTKNNVVNSVVKL